MLVDAKGSGATSVNTRADSAAHTSERGSDSDPWMTHYMNAMSSDTTSVIHCIRA
jgi:hypothetical protein